MIKTLPGTCTLRQEGRVWLQFGACDGDPILAVDFGQQGEVVATCELLGPLGESQRDQRANV